MPKGHSATPGIRLVTRVPTTDARRIDLVLLGDATIGTVVKEHTLRERASADIAHADEENSGDGILTH